MIVRVLLGAVLGVILTGSTLVACGTAPPALQDVPGDEVATAPTSSPSAAPTPDPTGLVIPAIGVRTTEKLAALGLTDDCPSGPAPCLAAPPLEQPQLAGWYAGADPVFNGDEWQPGENGPAVIAGHVDGIGPDGRKGHPGVFARLGQLAPGDEVIVERELAPPLTFVVDVVEHHAKDAFPTRRVYEDPTRGPELRLITCGGSFDRGSGHYVDNVIVWASLAS